MSAAGGATDGWVMFLLGDEEHALPAAAVREVVRWERPRPLPATRPHLLGVVARPSAVLPVFDLAGALGLGGAEDGAIVVVAAASGDIGLAVGPVRAVTFAPADALARAPGASPLVRGVVSLGERLLVALEPAAVLEALGEGPPRAARRRTASPKAAPRKPAARRRPKE